MVRRGRCRCGAVLKFHKKHNYKQVCHKCGSVVRLRIHPSNEPLGPIGTPLNPSTANHQLVETLADPPAVELEILCEPSENSLLHGSVLHLGWIIVASVLALGIVSGVIVWCAQ